MSIPKDGSLGSDYVAAPAMTSDPAPQLVFPEADGIRPPEFALVQGGPGRGVPDLNMFTDPSATYGAPPKDGGLGSDYVAAPAMASDPAPQLVFPEADGIRPPEFALVQGGPGRGVPDLNMFTDPNATYGAGGVDGTSGSVGGQETPRRGPNGMFGGIHGDTVVQDPDGTFHDTVRGIRPPHIAIAPTPPREIVPEVAPALEVVRLPGDLPAPGDLAGVIPPLPLSPPVDAPAPPATADDVKEVFEKNGTKVAIMRDMAGSIRIYPPKDSALATALEPFAPDKDGKIKATPEQWATLDQAMGGNTTPNFSIKRIEVTREDPATGAPIKESQVYLETTKGEIAKFTKKDLATAQQGAQHFAGEAPAPGPDVVRLPEAGHRPELVARPGPDAPAPSDRPPVSGRPEPAPGRVSAPAPARDPANLPTPGEAHPAAVPAARNPKGYPQYGEETTERMQKVLQALGKGEGLGKYGPKHDGVDGKWGPCTEKTFNGLCKEAGVDPSKVNLEGPPNAETLKLTEHIGSELAKKGKGQAVTPPHAAAPGPDPRAIDGEGAPNRPIVQASPQQDIMKGGGDPHTLPDVRVRTAGLEARGGRGV